MENMNVTAAKYIDLNGSNHSIKATIDGVEMYVPIEAGNRHYDEIMRQVTDGTLTIQDAD